MTDAPDLPPLPPLPPISSTGNGWTAREWLSERILFGMLLVGGYVGLGAASFIMPLTAQQSTNAHDVLLVLGPVVGMIAQAIWKTDKADKQNADSLAKVVASQAPDSTTTTTTKTGPA